MLSKFSKYINILNIDTGVSVSKQQGNKFFRDKYKNTRAEFVL